MCACVAAVYCHDGGYRPAVAFDIYDLKDTGVIERDEVKRLLAALLQDNPAIDLTDTEINEIVDQVQHQLNPSVLHMKRLEITGYLRISFVLWNLLAIDSSCQS